MQRPLITRITKYWLLLPLSIVAVLGLVYVHYFQRINLLFHGFTQVTNAPPAVPVDRLSPFQQSVLSDLKRQMASNIRYRDGYFQGGDPPPNIGVCTDVVIQSYRASGIDLQKEVARDILSHRSDYHIKKPDSNIDHRRCRNLAIFFRHRAKSLPIGRSADWEPGDIVFWDNGTGTAGHVGIIANARDTDGNPAIIHHWPGMAVSQTDGLFKLPVLYHFCWPESKAKNST